MQKPTSFTTRLANSDDQEVIADFNIAMALETEHKRLHPPTVAIGVGKVLAGEANAFYLLATHQKQVIGSLMITEEWSDWRAKRIWWIQSVYVGVGFRRQGVFTKLFEDLTQLADAQGDVCGFRLYVEKDNTIAQATYHSLDMQDSGYYLFETMAPL